MKIFLNLMVLSCAFTPILVFCDEVGPKRCEKSLVATSYVTPRIPPRLHNEYEGRAVVSFMINESGAVVNPVIVTSEWKPVGHSGNGPIGYHEAILAAVAGWKFPPRREGCINEAPVVIRFED